MIPWRDPESKIFGQAAAVEKATLDAWTWSGVQAAFAKAHRTASTTAAAGLGVWPGNPGEQNVSFPVRLIPWRDPESKIFGQAAAVEKATLDAWSEAGFRRRSQKLTAQLAQLLQQDWEFDPGTRAFSQLPYNPAWLGQENPTLGRVFFPQANLCLSRAAGQAYGPSVQMWQRPCCPCWKLKELLRAGDTDGLIRALQTPRRRSAARSLATISGRTWLLDWDTIGVNHQDWGV